MRRSLAVGQPLTVCQTNTSKDPSTAVNPPEAVCVRMESGGLPAESAGSTGMLA